MKVGVLGGTFDPIHVGHLMLADQVVNQLGLSKTLFVPSYRPPHKETGSICSVDDRVEMIKRAIAGNDRFELSTVERCIPGKGYTYKTLTVLKEEYDPGTEFYFIVGSDVLEDLVNFKCAEELMKSCTFVSALRPGADKGKLLALIDYLTKEFHASIQLIPFFEIGISSSLVRKSITAGESVRYFLPDSVIEYITQRQLYLFEKGATVV